MEENRSFDAEKLATSHPIPQSRRSRDYDDGRRQQPEDRRRRAVAGLLRTPRWVDKFIFVFYFFSLIVL